MRLCEIVMSGSPEIKGTTWKMADSSWYVACSSAITSALLTAYIRTWAWVPVWSQIEIDMGILAASLPSLSPLLIRMCAGFAMADPLTPSQLPDFPVREKDWIEDSKSSFTDVEKSMKADELSLCDDLSDVEEEVGVAQTADVRITAKPIAVRTVYIKS